MGKRFKFVILLSLCLAWPLGVEAARPALSTNRTPVISSSRLFHVAGGSSVDNLKMAAFADKIHQGVVDRLGSPVPKFSGNPILITLRPQAEERPRIERFQRYLSRSLHQEVLVLNPGQADQEHVLEALTWCLLNRYAVIRQPESRRKVNPVECPEWFSTGLAQTLFPVSKSRNRDLLSQSLHRQPFHSVGEILTWARLPDQRPLTHAECELQFQWLVDEDAEFLPAALKRLSAELDLGLEWVKEQCRLPSDRQLMMRRDVWLAREVLPHVALRPYQAEDVRGLQSLLNLELPLFGLFFDQPEEMRHLSDLIRALPNGPSQETLRLLNRELNKLNAGKSGPLHAWSITFIAFLREMISEAEESSPANLKRRLRRLQRLEQERQQLMGAWLKQDRYLDTFEKGN